MGIEYMMHVGICVRDLERSIRFYTEGLGFLEKGKLNVDGEPINQSDIYSIGATAYFLLTGRPVFSGDNPLRMGVSNKPGAIVTTLIP